jgi:ABC-type glycerol-3-phosphate transport system permease component
MRSIHPAPYEAARIDGAGWRDIFLRITIPLSSGGIATATIFIAIFAWNELLLPLFLTSRLAKTFPVVLTSFQGQTEIAWELMCAGATIQVLPIIAATFFVQKYIVSGLTLGSVK